MFYSLTGEIIFTDENSVAVDCGGVGFRCSTTLYTLRQLGPVGSKVTLFTHLNVREDSFDLFGFFDKNELECFQTADFSHGRGPKSRACNPITVNTG
jgi:holliday junction DNA helicase RuvA